MNLRKVMAAAALAATMSISAVCAMDIGIVNVPAVVQSYPGVQSYVQKEKAVRSQYEPKLQEIATKIQQEQDRTKAEKMYNDEFVPVEKQAGEAVSAIWKDVFDKINVAVREVRASKNLPIVVSDPNAIIATEGEADGVDITNEVIAAVKK